MKYLLVWLMMRTDYYFHVRFRMVGLLKGVKSLVPQDMIFSTGTPVVIRQPLKGYLTNSIQSSGIMPN